MTSSSAYELNSVETQKSGNFGKEQFTKSCFLLDRNASLSRSASASMLSRAVSSGATSTSSTLPESTNSSRTAAQRVLRQLSPAFWRKTVSTLTSWGTSALPCSNKNGIKVFVCSQLVMEARGSPGPGGGGGGTYLLHIFKSTFCDRRKRKSLQCPLGIIEARFECCS